MTPERAEILALDALAWLVGQEEDLQAFLNLSGMDVAQLRRCAGSPGMSVAILDFLMVDEPLLLRFCEDTELDPRKLQAARHALDGNKGGDT